MKSQPVSALAPRAPEPREAPKRSRLDERAWAEAYRKENQLSKAALAEMIGYSRTTYSRFEEGSYEGDEQDLRAAIRAMRDRIEGPGGLSAVVGFRETEPLPRRRVDSTPPGVHT